MPTIRTLATALPPHTIQQTEARQFSRNHFGESFPHIDQYMSVFENAAIDTRSFVVPAEWFQGTHSFQECNALFVEWAVKLDEEATNRCLHNVGLTPTDVDHLIFVSTTGLASPSIDAYLINTLQMGKHTRRTPVWGLGCAGGVAGLSRAYEYALAFPEHRVLLLCVELCSITFQWDDLSKRNLIATAIFSDGAAAVLVEGDNVKQPQDNLANGHYQAKVLGTQSTLWHDTLPIMGWDIKDTGFEVVFSSRIPHLVQDLIHDTITEFLDQYNIALSQIRRFIFHPGGTKVIRAYERVLKGGKDGFEHAHEVLRKHGNMSSPSVFFVYESALRDNPLEPGEYALMVVLGPGFSCEMALIQG